MKALDNGSICFLSKTITFTALPCPLPAVWREQFIKAGIAACDARRVRALQGVKSDPVLPEAETLALLALEQRARAAIGFEFTRPVVMPVVRDSTRGEMI